MVVLRGDFGPVRRAVRGTGKDAHEVVTGCSAARQGHPRRLPGSGCGAEGGKRVSRVDRAVAQRG
ncbi:hypothetical protein GCM10027186_37230 [Micromonospora schwarzwaldensis]